MTKDKALVLPPPNHHGGTYESSPFNYYTADQMREYANLVADAEREACAVACDEQGYFSAGLCAAKIRARSQS
jgi:protein tyrosine/serine phosphatase